MDDYSDSPPTFLQPRPPTQNNNNLNSFEEEFQVKIAAASSSATSNLSKYAQLLGVLEEMGGFFLIFGWVGVVFEKIYFSRPQHSPNLCWLKIIL